ncbi:MAG: FG-GAP repeat protein [Myxococcota bacterium]
MRTSLLLLLAACSGPDALQLGRTPPALDLAVTTDGIRHLYGADNERGSFGVPVAGGHDVDGDGLADVALSAMRASPLDRENAGTVHLAFGDGTTSGAVDSYDDPSVLDVVGVSPQENAGSEIWMGDVTGDGLADLLVARQNATVGDVIGCGAVSIVAGDPDLRARAAAGEPLDLAEPDGHLTLAGTQPYGRVGIWLRTGDVTGDGVLDLLVGADQEDGHLGAAYLLEGGPWLAEAGTVTTGALGPLQGHVLHLLGRTDTDEAHFGATVQLADLDGDGRAEIVAASTLNRAGASLAPFDPADPPQGEAHGRGGVPHGAVDIVWADGLPDPPWDAPLALDDPPGPVTRLLGTNLHNHFGEELVGGFDWDGDGRPDLFVGDLASDLSGDGRPFSGVGTIFWDAGKLHDLRSLQLGNPPAPLLATTLYGAEQGDLFADTAGGGDFDGDGRDDLVVTSPDADPDGRSGAGRALVLFGGQGRWPPTVDTNHAGLPPASVVRVVEAWGALGTVSNRDYGDMLAYSAAVGDIDGDGTSDLVSNEMLGNGLQPDTLDVGNLVVISGAALSAAEAR